LSDSGKMHKHSGALVLPDSGRRTRHGSIDASGDTHGFSGDIPWLIRVGDPPPLLCPVLKCWNDCIAGRRQIARGMKNTESDQGENSPVRGVSWWAVEHATGLANRWPVSQKPRRVKPRVSPGRGQPRYSWRRVRSGSRLHRVSVPDRDESGPPPLDRSALDASRPCRPRGPSRFTTVSHGAPTRDTGQEKQVWRYWNVDPGGHCPRKKSTWIHHPAPGVRAVSPPGWPGPPARPGAGGDRSRPDPGIRTP
jgi:hypothetical protein